MKSEQRGDRIVLAAITAIHILFLGIAATSAQRVETPSPLTIKGELLLAEANIETAPEPLPMANDARPLTPTETQEPTKTTKKPPARLPSPVSKPQPIPKLARPQSQSPQVLAVASNAEPTVAAMTSPAVSAAVTTAAPTPAPPTPQPPLTTTPSNAPAEAAITTASVSAQQKAALMAAATPPRSDAAHLNNPTPVYPTVSRRAGEQGRVLLDVHILPDGSVGEIKLKHSSGFERLDDAAIKAVQRWRYVPARRGDQPIAWWYVQPIVFSIES